MEDAVENGLELTNYLTDKYWDRGYDKVAGKFSRKQAESQARSSDPDSADARGDAAVSTAAAAASVPSAGHAGRSSTPASASALPVATPSTLKSRQQPPFSRNYLPPPGRAPPFSYSRNAHRDARFDTESDTSERVLRAYEREADDPKRKLESVLSARDLDHLRKSRRDSAMSTNDYQSRPRSQPPRSRYYDDDDSDYDEKTGRRYKGGAASNRGYGGGDYRDDRDDEVLYQETERYRGPVSSGPLVPVQRQDSYRSGYDSAGAVTQYDRRTRRDDERDTRVSRRSKSRTRDRDRSYSGSRSRSGSRDGSKRKLEDHFDTTPRGIGIGIAGAVIGGLAGREFGKQHQKRDMLIGAIVGGLGANAVETKWRDWKEEKREREEEQRWDSRSRSTQR